jgi:hypothetical protein
VRLNLFNAAIFALVLSACGGGTAGNDNSEIHKQSYQYQVGSCDTGKQEIIAKSTEEMRTLLCARLQDERTNHGCAWRLRNEHYLRVCVASGPSPGSSDDDEIWGRRRSY